MNILITRIRRLLDDCSIGEGDRNQFVAIALAQSLANSLSLPTTPVTSISAYFNNTHSIVVNSILAGFNDKYTIDIFYVKELVKKCYTYRYCLVFDPSGQDTLRLMTFMYATDNTALPSGLSQMLASTSVQENMVKLNALVSEFKLGWKDELRNETVIVG